VCFNLKVCALAMAKINTCPAGHLLQPWNAQAGGCDGCHKLVKNGEQVMDCRQCNWYLCEDCHPPDGTQPTTFWGTISSLLDVSCQVPTVQVTGSEIIIETGSLRGAPKKAAARAPSGIAGVVEAPIVVASAAAADVHSASSSRTEGTGSVSVQGAEPSLKKVEVRQAEEKERQKQPEVPVVDLLDLEAEEVVVPSTVADLMSLQIDAKVHPEAPPAVNAARLGA
jgi:hypothetical protein